MRLNISPSNAELSRVRTTADVRVTDDGCRPTKRGLDKMRIFSLREELSAGCRAGAQVVVHDH
jgi:hypothetical protein